ncbi:class II SORL domain-containing protein [Candidatus Magnetomonas plexicatena]|uniref:class II SORL domain-containing protein n=1 Tax=Candidatus Magnetomonas plexicatena TaxID=2552947 RepID=UPI0011022ABB|nr:Neelaredoxin [Nitrospirales bacterium LBB_01]
MSKTGDIFQGGDWKGEKHVPVIECADAVGADELFDVKVSVGKEIGHPNTTEHHIRWIQLFFKPTDGKFSYQIGNFEFTAHGESAEGANAGPVYTNHAVTASMKTKKSGTLIATSFCNIHGFWESSKDVAVK